MEEAVRIGLVSCTKSKATSATRAADLYTSPLLRGARRTVEEQCDRWFVLSAKHHLVSPKTIVEPYDLTLVAVGVAERRRWSAEVTRQLQDELGDLGQHAFEIHAGRAYCSYGLVASLRAAGAEVELPLDGLSLGRRLAWYAARNS
jgi:hypothetical protein